MQFVFNHNTDAKLLQSCIHILKAVQYISYTASIVNKIQEINLTQIYFMRSYTAVLVKPQQCTSTISHIILVQHAQTRHNGEQPQVVEQILVPLVWFQRGNYNTRKTHSTLRWVTINKSMTMYILRYSSQTTASQQLHAYWKSFIIIYHQIWLRRVSTKLPLFWMSSHDIRIVAATCL